MFINKNLIVLENENPNEACLNKAKQLQQQPSCQSQEPENNLQVHSHQIGAQIQANGQDQMKNAGKSCNCKRSKCLKMYCECYLAGSACNLNCKCIGCENQTVSDRMANRIANQEDGDLLKKSKGCNCRKSECQKKYCECFNSGLPCNELCKCQECKNMTNGDTSELQNSLEASESVFKNVKGPESNKNSQLNKKLSSLMDSVPEKYQESMKQFLYYLLS